MMTMTVTFNFLGLGQHVDIRIALENEDNRKKEELRMEDGQVYPLPIYYDGETVSGNVLIGMKRGKSLEHQGIRIEFLGVIDFYTDRGNRDEFIALSQDLARPGILSQPTTYPFEFSHIEKPHESYCGTNVRLRYLLRVTVQRRMTDLTTEREILVHAPARYLEPDTGIQMEVGIEDSLHIEFEYNKSKYHLQDVIVGKIYFLLVRVKIKNMEIQILKRETLGSGPNSYSDSETLAKYEIMDGAPVRGESIPIRLFLHGYSLTPTMRDVNRKFSVRFFLNLVLLDEEDRRYYKQQEIVLYRKPDRRRKPLGPSACVPDTVSSATTGLQQKENNEPNTTSDDHSELTEAGDRPSEENDVFAERTSGVAETEHKTPEETFLAATGKEASAKGVAVPDRPAITLSDVEFDDNDHEQDSEGSESPGISRTARSMHRYESRHDRSLTKPDGSPNAEDSQNKRTNDVFIEEPQETATSPHSSASPKPTETKPNHSNTPVDDNANEMSTVDVA
ncbi:unnamed protein product [Echinostoma caproni]|uniref:Vacuolar protein sorting-associated protein 26 n=1 Tax=Echinostoma caproni TaxID=27848 RepID=A0A183AGP2_9TREM|nr:unnamed protein product [Echinostoma caproni]